MRARFNGDDKIRGSDASHPEQSTWTATPKPGAKIRRVMLEAHATKCAGVLRMVNTVDG